VFRQSDPGPTVQSRDRQVRNSLLRLAATVSLDSSNPVIAEVMVMLEPISRLFVLTDCAGAFLKVGTALGITCDTNVKDHTRSWPDTLRGRMIKLLGGNRKCSRCLCAACSPSLR